MPFFIYLIFKRVELHDTFILSTKKNAELHVPNSITVVFLLSKPSLRDVIYHLCVPNYKTLFNIFMNRIKKNKNIHHTQIKIEREKVSIFDVSYKEE